MAKRVIHECDLTKQEIDEDDVLFTLKLAKKGSRTNMTYELSSAAAEKLLAQLNGRDELEENWNFTSVQDFPVPPSDRKQRRTLEDLEAEAEEKIEDDSRFVAEKKAALREQGVLSDEETEEPREEPTDGPVGKALGATTDQCRHMNKSRIQTTMRGGKRFIYRKCADCRKDIPEMTSEARQSYMKGKAPKGVNIRDL
jgi:hypothetical protein